jgi:hypothetical protein
MGACFCCNRQEQAPFLFGAREMKGKMERYIGTKIILAEREDKEGRPGYKVVYEDGYTSWSPLEAFERAYRRITDAELALLK